MSASRRIEPRSSTQLEPLGAFSANWSKVKHSPPAAKMRFRAVSEKRSAQTDILGIWSVRGSSAELHRKFELIFQKVERFPAIPTRSEQLVQLQAADPSGSGLRAKLQNEKKFKFNSPTMLPTTTAVLFSSFRMRIASFDIDSGARSRRGAISRLRMTLLKLLFVRRARNW